VELGEFLVRHGYVKAMIDLSDGLASDLRHLCRAGRVGARVDAGRLPLSDALRAAAAGWGVSPEEVALQGGEDYQLLFAVPAGLQEKMETQAQRHLGVPLFRIGEIIPSKRIILRASGRDCPLPFRGFEHFGADAA
jgi:thiamine-monophosphate kinase